MQLQIMQIVVSSFRIRYKSLKKSKVKIVLLLSILVTRSLKFTCLNYTCLYNWYKYLISFHIRPTYLVSFWCPFWVGGLSTWFVFLSTLYWWKELLYECSYHWTFNIKALKEYAAWNKPLQWNMICGWCLNMHFFVDMSEAYRIHHFLLCLWTFASQISNASIMRTCIL